MGTPPFVCFGSPLTEVLVTQRHTPSGWGFRSGSDRL